MLLTIYIIGFCITLHFIFLDYVKNDIVDGFGFIVFTLPCFVWFLWVPFYLLGLIYKKGFTR